MKTYFSRLLCVALMATLHLAANDRPCGVGPEMTKYLHQMGQENPELKQRWDQAKERQEAWLEQFKHIDSVHKKATYTIPVVFHIMTWNNDGDVPDSKIYEALNIVNEDFSAQNGVYDNIIPAFAGIVGNANIEFVLPTRDPDGNPTTGITRDVTIHTYNGNWDRPQLKRVNSWPHEKYLNVWVVNSSDGGNGSAWAYLPETVDEGTGIEDLDGIVISTWALGATTQGYYSILTHEIGHSLNLQHTWGSGENGAQESCNTDDGVADTPNCRGFAGSCNTNFNSCGSLDMIQNFMDYSTCAIAYSQGQVDRMHSALNSTVALRNQLWSQNNLIETGVISGNALANYAASAKAITPGESVSFSDASIASSGSVTSWSWSFPGGTPSSFNGQNPPAIAYNTAGSYDVSLTVTTSTGASHQIVRKRSVTVGNDLVMHEGQAVVSGGRFSDNQPTRYYDHNQNSVLTALPNDSARKLRFSFADFSLGSGDSLAIYDGTSTSSPLIGTYTGSNSPGIVTATNSAGALTFRFVANGSGNSDGWSGAFGYDDADLHIMSSDAVVASDGTFVDPGLGFNYGNNYDASKTFMPVDSSKKLRFVFTNLFMEASDANCEFDLLEVFDGTSTGAPLIGTFCNTNSPGYITATNAQGALTFRFKSDNNTSGPGWQAHFFEVDPGGAEYLMSNSNNTGCDALFFDAGRYNAYADNSNQTKTLYPSTAGQKVRLHFGSFQMERDDENCTYDYLRIYDGTSTGSPLIGTFCNTNSPGVVAATNSNGALTFAFTSDDNTTGPGWSAKVDCVDASETGIYTMASTTITANQGIFLDSGGYNAYSNDANTVMTFKSANGDPLTFTFASFSMEESDADCLYDYLEVYDGDSTSAPLIDTFCNLRSPGVITATNGQGALTFRFISDDNTTGHGWAASFTTGATDPNTAPVVNITGPADGSTYNNGEAITFTGTANDTEDGDLSANLQWSSSIDGSLGSGASVFVGSLSLGTHTITASVSDSGGLSGADSITVVIADDQNQPPTVQITAPADGSTYTDGDTVTFTGTANDVEDGDLSAAITWNSSLDGQIGSGASVSTASLSVGSHTITASATDTGGLTSTDSLTITVQSGGIPVINPGQTISGLSGSQGGWVYYRIEVPTNVTNLTISISGGSGDADLYTRFGQIPDESNYDCRPYVGGNSETCTNASPNVGTWFIGLRGYNAFSGVSLTANYDITIRQGFTETGLAAAQDGWLYFTIDVPAGTTRMEIDIHSGSGDADLYVRRGAQPTLNDWDYRPYIGGNAESVEVTNPAVDTWHIGIRGYNAFSGLTLEAYTYQ